MKAEINQSTPHFKPVSITLTFETQGELNIIAEIANIDEGLTAEFINKNGFYKTTKSDVKEFKCQVYDIMGPFRKCI